MTALLAPCVRVLVYFYDLLLFVEMGILATFCDATGVTYCKLNFGLP